MRKKIQKRRPRKSTVLPVREVNENPADTGTPAGPGPGSLGDPHPFTDFPRCSKCRAEEITLAYQREYNVLMCSCAKCGHQWDMLPKDKEV